MILLSNVTSRRSRIVAYVNTSSIIISSKSFSLISPKGRGFRRDCSRIESISTLQGPQSQSSLLVDRSRRHFVSNSLFNFENLSDLANSYRLSSQIRQIRSNRLFSTLGKQKVDVSNNRMYGMNARDIGQSYTNLSDKIVVVRDSETAKKVLQVLYSNPDTIWACDTEVSDIDFKIHGPIGNGYVTCVSIFGGPDISFDFLGNGDSNVFNIASANASTSANTSDHAYRGKVIWIDNLDGAAGTLDLFKDWFEDSKFKKVWHNYSFDRHVMHNHNIDCQGFHGDTMHMARIWDSSRDRSLTGSGDGYSLAALSLTLTPHLDLEKVSMKDLFGLSKTLKDGTQSKLKEIPDIRSLQASAETRQQWVEYSCRDAVVTWFCFQVLVSKLQLMPWKVEDITRPNGHPNSETYKQIGTMLDFYFNYLVDFGELLTDIERNGILVDTKKHLKDAEAKAREEYKLMEKIFRAWLLKCVPDPHSAAYINPTSTVQMQQLFFGEYENKLLKSTERVFKIEKTADEIAAERVELISKNPYVEMDMSQLKILLRERGLKISGKKSELFERLIKFDNALKVNSRADGNNLFESISLDTLEDICKTRGISIPENADKALLIHLLQSDMDLLKKGGLIIDEKNNLVMTPITRALNSNTSLGALSIDDENISSRLKKYKEISLTTLGMKPITFTPTGVPQVSASVLRKMAGPSPFDEKDPVFGEAFDFFGGGDRGKEACQAIGALAQMGQIETTIANFLIPLQSLVDKNGRIHCSINLNTETGRLSARRPNLQNQPALEKDNYKIRDAFIAEPGNSLIVADYGQLELRLLAHIANCKSMIDAFKKGGCFHSRTALGMYDYIRKAVDSGEVLLEWDNSRGPPPVPLVKDKFASERRKAKTLNFSIAYGKTVHGLAQDWGISIKDATQTLEAWYSDRPEVKQWQESTRRLVKAKSYVRTIMGRYRRLVDANSHGPAGGHALRAAINTPIQGSAADIVMMAMIKLWRSEELKALGWKLLLQVHDEVILEGPSDKVDQAMKEVKRCMENPFDNRALFPLKVHLDVDAKSASSWYKAK